MSAIRASIVIPVFNQSEAFLKRSIGSAYACVEEDAGVELVIVDNGSTPPVAEYLLPKNARVRLVRFDRNLGIFADWNRAIRLCAGEMIWLLCADDSLSSKTFAECIAQMEATPQISMISTAGRTESSDHIPLGEIGTTFSAGRYDGYKAAKVFYEFYMKTGINPFNYPSGVLMRRSSLEKSGFFDESMRHIGDIELYFRLMSVGVFEVSRSVGCTVTLHQMQAGKVLGRKPYGMIEVREMVNSRGFLSESERKLYRAFAEVMPLIFVASGLIRRQPDVVKTYGKHFLQYLSWSTIFQIFPLFFWKLSQKMDWARLYWQRKLDRARI